MHNTHSWHSPSLFVYNWLLPATTSPTNDRSLMRYCCKHSNRQGDTQVARSKREFAALKWKRLQWQPRSTSVWKLHECYTLTEDPCSYRREQLHTEASLTAQAWGIPNNYTSCMTIPSLWREQTLQFKHFSHAGNPSKMPWMTAVTQRKDITAYAANLWALYHLPRLMHL